MRICSRRPGRSPRFAPWFIALLGLLALVTGSPRTARAGAQVSADFSRVAKALAKRVSADGLKDICAKKPAAERPVCEAIADAAAASFEMAIDGKVDETELSAVLVELATRLTEAAAADAAKQLITTLLEEAERYSDGSCRLTIKTQGRASVVAARQIAERLSGCVVGRALKQEKDACRGLEAELLSLEVACAAGAPVADSYAAELLFTQLERLLTASTPAGFYAAVANGVQSYEVVFSGIDSPNDATVFDARTIDELIATDAPGCTSLEKTRARLREWKKAAPGVFIDLSRALAGFETLPKAALDAIPVVLPDAGCPTGHALPKPFADFVTSARTYRTDVKLVAAVDPIVLPSLLGALLVDYARDHDERALREHAEDFALRVLARTIAARDRSGFVCDAGNCSELAANAGGSVVLQPAGMPSAEVQAVIEDRFSPAAARRTCEYQAIASALGRNVELGPSHVCRKLGLSGRANVLGVFPFVSLLETNPQQPLFAKWSSAEPVRGGVMRLSVAGQIDPGVGRYDLALVLEALQRGLPEGHSLLPISGALTEALRPVLDQRTSDFSRVLLAESARKLHPLVDSYLDHRLVPLACAEGKDATELACGVRVLIGAVYDPMVGYIMIEKPTDADRKRLATLAYKKALELDPLSRTPLLFNVGLGATGLTRFGSDDGSLHLTLLDKFGVAVRWGERNGGEAGVFVGGFLDALIRTAANAPEQEQYWLAGGTLGFRQFGAGIPFGGALHVAVAMPFDLQKTSDRIAFAAGAALTVPADIAFGE